MVLLGQVRVGDEGTPGHVVACRRPPGGSRSYTDEVGEAAEVVGPDGEGVGHRAAGGGHRGRGGLLVHHQHRVEEELADRVDRVAGVLDGVGARRLVGVLAVGDGHRLVGRDAGPGVVVVDEVVDPQRLQGVHGVDAVAGSAPAAARSCRPRRPGSAAQVASLDVPWSGQSSPSVSTRSKRPSLSRSNLTCVLSSVAETKIGDRLRSRTPGPGRGMVPCGSPQAAGRAGAPTGPRGWSPPGRRTPCRSRSGTCSPATSGPSRWTATGGRRR